MFFNRYSIDYKEDQTYIRVLKILQAHVNKEVSVWHIIMTAKVAHHQECMSRLRKKGYTIINRLEHKGRVTHSYYKLIIENDKN